MMPSTVLPEGQPKTATAPRVAYVMSRFPKLTETFVLYEILAMERQGALVEIYPLLREHQPVAHPEAEALVRRAHFSPFLSAPIVAANLYFAVRRPGAYFGALRQSIGGTWRSANLLKGALGIFPKSVWFARRMQRTGVQHVHAHFATHPALAAWIVHRLTNIPFSFTAHGSDLHVRRRMLDRKVDGAAFVVAISSFNRDVIVGTCGPGVADKVRVIHCGVDPDVFAPRGARRTPGPFRIVCVASFEEVKGHEYLLDACRTLAGQGLDFTCDLVGDGPRRTAIESRIAAHGLQDRVHVRGPQPRDRVREFLRQADAAVLTSVPTAEGKKEGIPVVLMEAMAAGLPVVASRLSGIPELVRHGETGLLAEPRDVPAIAAALTALAQDPVQAARMGAAGRELVLEQFHQERNAAVLLQCFRQVIGGDACST